MEMRAPPRYSDFRPDKHSFHAARTIWFYEATGGILSGTVKEQDRTFNGATRAYRKNKRNSMQKPRVKQWTLQHDVVLLSLRAHVDSWDKIAKILHLKKDLLQARFQQYLNAKTTDYVAQQAKKIDAAYTLCSVRAPLTAPPIESQNMHTNVA
jgi:hypothetical protein